MTPCPLTLPLSSGTTPHVNGSVRRVGRVSSASYKVSYYHMTVDTVPDISSSYKYTYHYQLYLPDTIPRYMGIASPVTRAGIADSYRHSSCITINIIQLHVSCVSVN